MQLTQFSDYSLEYLIYLGLSGEQLSTIEEIAAAYGISESHLTKVARNWASSALSRPCAAAKAACGSPTSWHEINIGATIRLTETNRIIVECFDVAHNTCPIAPVCALAGVLGEALDGAFLAVLDRYTLAGVLKNRRDLGDLLRVVRPIAHRPHRFKGRRPLIQIDSVLPRYIAELGPAPFAGRGSGNCRPGCCRLRPIGAGGRPPERPPAP